MLNHQDKETHQILTPSDKYMYMYLSVYWVACFVFQHQEEKKITWSFLSVIGILGEKDNFISVADRIHAIHMIVLHFDY